MIEVSAPGKLMLTGEYSVLSGAPALVMAINRRARVIVEPSNTWSLEAIDIGLPQSRFTIGSGGVDWHETPGPGAGMVNSVLNWLWRERILHQDTIPARIKTLSSALSLPETGQKLGLGSSAAILVAVGRALIEHAGGSSRYGWDTFDAELFTRLHAAHSAGQGKRGSGADVAASLTGGLVCYALKGTVANCRVVSLPDAIKWSAIWSGRSASTANRLRSMSRAAQSDKQGFDSRIAALAEIATQAAAACKHDNAPALLASIQQYGRQIEAFGHWADIDIVSPAHKRLMQLADAHGVIYKTSGAGGGDLGLAFSLQQAQLAAFQEAAASAGHQSIHLAIDPDGVEVAGP